MDAQPIEGMTVNERLFHFSLADRFDAAARSGDVPAMVRVLLQAQLSEAQASQTARAIAADPKFYGY